MDGGDDTGEDKWAKAVIREGEWAGWSYLAGDDPFEDTAGPFYFRHDEKGPLCAFRPQAKHMNGGNFLHGGCLMTFADFALFVIARPHLRDSHSVTATFNAEFVGAVYEGQLVECRGEVVKAGRSIVFVRGLMSCEGEPVLTFSAALKKVRPRAA